MSAPHAHSFADEYTQFKRHAAHQFKKALIPHDFDPKASPPLYEVVFKSSPHHSQHGPQQKNIPVYLSIVSAAEMTPGDDSDPTLLWGFAASSRTQRFDIEFCGRRRKFTTQEFSRAVRYTTRIASHKLRDFEGGLRQQLKPEDIQTQGKYNFLLLPLEDIQPSASSEQAIEDGEILEQDTHISRISIINQEEMSRLERGMIGLPSEM
jgi:hypothetical protein